MSEWNPSVVKIESVETHPNADALDIAKVLGDYPVIVKRGEYKAGDLASYIPVDSIVPNTEEYFFLSPKAYEQYEEDGVVKNRVTGFKYPACNIPEKYRIIKASKIRNIFSMGMLVPPVPGLKEGDSVVEFLVLKKWEEDEEENIQGQQKLRGANAEKPPSGWSIPHYDIEGLRKYIDAFIPNEEVVLHEKLHGSNASFSHDGERLWVKSRNFFKKEDEIDSWWDVALRMNLKEKLAKYPRLAFFGELIGQVKGFKYDAVIENGRLLTKVRFFDIFDTARGKYVDHDEFMRICTDVDLPNVPLLYRGPWLGKEEMYNFAEGKSTLNDKHVREGFVAKPVVERFEPKLGGRLLLKFIGQGYALQK